MGIIMPWGPDTTVTIYSGVNFDPTYANIRLFESNGERDAYLEPLVKERFLYCSVVSPGVVRLTGQQQNFISCDYLRFQNHVPGRPERPIFCFIRSVDYVNNNTFSVTFDIDWVMSWLQEIRFKDCFVIREHVNDDTPGKWVEEEGLEIGEIVRDGEFNALFRPSVLLQLIDLNNVLSFNEKDGMVRSGRMEVYNMEQLGILSDTVNSLKDHPEYIPMIVMGVENFSDGTVAAEGKAFNKKYDVPSANLIFNTGLTGEYYEAKNNKLMTYPYKFMTADNFGGQVENYRYEMFDDMSPKFIVFGICYPAPVLEFYPWHYKNSKTSNYDQQAIIFDDFPQVGWTSDTYQLNLAHYASQPIATAASGITTFVKHPSLKVGAAMAGATALSALEAYNDYKYDKKTTHSSQYKSGTSSGAINFAKPKIGFRVTKYMITPKFAKKIDNFFSRYGYTVNMYKKPNIIGRQIVNYVQTQDAHVAGEIPVETRTIMERALNSGVSFWHVNEMSLGDDYNNPIVGG